MESKHLKFGVAGIILITSLGYLTYAASRGQTWVYHLSVDQFMASPQYRAERVRLCGTVEKKNFSADSAQLLARFILKGTTATVPVEYHGVIPDLFKADREVVIEGQLDNAGVFHADVLMTKCASKYEAIQEAKGKP